MRDTHRSDRQLTSVESRSTPWQVEMFDPSWALPMGVLEKFYFQIERLTKVGTNHIRHILRILITQRKINPTENKIKEISSFYFSDTL